MLAVVCRSAWAGDAADAPPLYHLGFDTYIPGQSPTGWSVSWGEQGDHLILVSNVQAADGKNSLLLDRKVGTTKKPCQLQWTMPGSTHTRKWTEISFCVFIDGKASESQFDVSLGDCHPRRTVKIVFSLRGWGPTIHLYPNAPGFNWYQNWEAKRELCRWEARSWHRIRVFLPAQGKNLATAYGMVERKGKTGAWEPVGKPQSVPAGPLQDKALHGYLSSSNKIGFALFVDDLEVRETDDLPKGLLAAVAAPAKKP